MLLADVRTILNEIVLTVQKRTKNILIIIRFRRDQSCMQCMSLPCASDCLCGLSGAWHSNSTVMHYWYGLISGLVHCYVCLCFYFHITQQFSNFFIVLGHLDSITTRIFRALAARFHSILGSFCFRYVLVHVLWTLRLKLKNTRHYIYPSRRVLTCSFIPLFPSPSTRSFIVISWITFAMLMARSGCDSRKKTLSTSVEPLQ